MRKLLLLSIMLLLVSFGIQGVGAEEVIVDEVLEPSSFDNWIALITDFASLKNFIVSIGGLGTIIMLAKVRGLYKYLKSAKGLVAIENMFVKVVAKITDKPELVIKIMKIVATMPIISNLLDKAQRKADMYEFELQGKILDYEAKIAAKVFEGDSLQRAMLYLTKLREEYEIIKTSV